jgi:proteic killer suppression protein
MMIERRSCNPQGASIAKHLFKTNLQEMEDIQELRDVPSWNAHQLTGDRKGSWSLTVTRNWRITFRIEQAEREILDLDYEDYH